MTYAELARKEAERDVAQRPVVGIRVLERHVPRCSFVREHPRHPQGTKIKSTNRNSSAIPASIDSPFSGNERVPSGTRFGISASAYTPRTASSCSSMFCVREIISYTDHANVLAADWTSPSAARDSGILPGLLNALIVNAICRRVGVSEETERI